MDSSSSLSYISISIPALQLQIFAFFWRQLVANPVETMSRSLLPAVALIQIVYAVAFLPVAGSTKASRKPRPGEKRKVGGGGDPNIAVVSFSNRFCSLLLLLLFLKRARQG